MVRFYNKRGTAEQIPPDRGHGDVSLPQEGDWRMIVRKCKVEIGNSGLDVMTEPVQRRAVLKRPKVHPVLAELEQSARPSRKSG